MLISLFYLYNIFIILHVFLFFIDRGGGPILVFLDLSYAFDKIDQTELFNLWQDTFEMSGSALDLLKSYLDGRTQCVQIDKFCSEYAPEFMNLDTFLKHYLSNNNQLLLVSCQPRTKLKTYGEITFQYAALNEWYIYC